VTILFGEAIVGALIMYENALALACQLLSYCSHKSQSLYPDISAEKLVTLRLPPELSAKKVEEQEPKVFKNHSCVSAEPVREKKT
jgi:hypothetical protein